MDEQARRVEHFSELRQGVRTDRRGELPRSLPVDDYLAGLETPPEQVERCVLEDDGPVVARLPALRRRPPRSVPGQLLRPEEGLVAPLPDPRHPHPANGLRGKNPSALTSSRSASRLFHRPRARDVRGP